MALTPGTRLGPYEIAAQIGVGGMGEVYRATDTKLKRDVAVKVLPALLASDPERLARFQREAEVLASLNHPNIAAIHGLEESEGIKALVMELVAGPTLADRIAQAAIPVDEALPIAKQIVEALALALLAPIAWQLLLLRHIARALPDAPAQVALSSRQIRVLHAASVGRTLPQRPTTRDALLAVARLGGHLRQNGEPGWQVLGRGMQKLLRMEAGWAAAEQARGCDQS